jgi:hypothetical protein
MNHRFPAQPFSKTPPPYWCGSYCARQSKSEKKKKKKFKMPRSDPSLVSPAGLPILTECCPTFQMHLHHRQPQLQIIIGNSRVCWISNYIVLTLFPPIDCEQDAGWFGHRRLPMVWLIRSNYFWIRRLICLYSVGQTAPMLNGRILWLRLYKVSCFGRRWRSSAIDVEKMRWLLWQKRVRLKVLSCCPRICVMTTPQNNTCLLGDPFFWQIWWWTFFAPATKTFCWLDRNFPLSLLYIIYIIYLIYIYNNLKWTSESR